jgi:hypothetical protein
VLRARVRRSPPEKGSTAKTRRRHGREGRQGRQTRIGFSRSGIIREQSGDACPALLSLSALAELSLPRRDKSEGSGDPLRVSQNCPYPVGTNSKGAETLSPRFAKLSLPGADKFKGSGDPLRNWQTSTHDELGASDYRVSPDREQDVYERVHSHNDVMNHQRRGGRQDRRDDDGGSERRSNASPLRCVGRRVSPPERRSRD